MYAKLIVVITSAAAVVAAIFGLFNSVLKDLMPDVEGAAQAVNVACFSTTIVLLALTLVIRKRLSVISQYGWAAAGVACLAAAVFAYFSLGDLVRAYVYYYPPGSGQAVASQPLLSGPLHEKGKERKGDMDVATAVSKHGGPDVVNGHQLLWTQEARSQLVGSFVRRYTAIAFLMTTALFMVAIAVWRTARA